MSCHPDLVQPLSVSLWFHESVFELLTARTLTLIVLVWVSWKIASTKVSLLSIESIVASKLKTTVQGFRQLRYQLLRP